MGWPASYGHFIMHTLDVTFYNLVKGKIGLCLPVHAAVDVPPRYMTENPKTTPGLL